MQRAGIVSVSSVREKMAFGGFFGGGVAVSMMSPEV